MLTYAFFSASGVENNATESNVVTLTSEYGNVIVSYLNENTINTEDVVLVEDAGDSNSLIKFSIENTGSISRDLIISWDDLVNDFCSYQSNGVCTNVSIDTDVRNELNYTLYECADEIAYNDAEIGDLANCSAISELNTTVPKTDYMDNMHTTDRVTVESDTTEYFVFVLTIENHDYEQNYQQGKSMSGKIMVDYYYNLDLQGMLEDEKC